MNVRAFLGRMKLRQRDAEVIFDRDEPVGTPTDLVMPRKRWFRRNKPADSRAPNVGGAHARSQSSQP